MVEAELQTWPSLVPLYPPAETITSPPSERTSLMTLATWVSEETGSVPSQAGAHELPSARMNAISNAFCPVAAITVPRSGALESSVL